MVIVCLFLAELYFSLHFKRAKFFVYTTLVIDLLYPFVLKLKERRFPWKFIILEGTLIPSLLYGAWMLFYPQKIYVYYIPMLIWAVGKIYHHICLENPKDSEDLV